LFKQFCMHYWFLILDCVVNPVVFWSFFPATYYSHFVSRVPEMFTTLVQLDAHIFQSAYESVHIKFVWHLAALICMHCLCINIRVENHYPWEVPFSSWLIVLLCNYLNISRIRTKTFHFETLQMKLSTTRSIQGRGKANQNCSVCHVVVVHV